MLVLVAEHVPTDPAGYALAAAGLVPLLEIGQRSAARRSFRLGLALEPDLLTALTAAGWMRQFVAWCHAGAQRAELTATLCDQRGQQQQGYVARYTAAQLHHVAEFAQQLRADTLLPALTDAARRGWLELIAAVPAGPFAAQLAIAQRTLTEHAEGAPAAVWLPYADLVPEQLGLLTHAGVRTIIMDSPYQGPSGLPAGRPVSLGDGALLGLTRDLPLSRLVSSLDLGYPGDPLFASERRDRTSGLRFWRHALGAADALYDPFPAMQRVTEHAAHFVASVSARLQEPDQIAVVALDFWHLADTWAEGMVWLRVLADLAAHQDTWQWSAPGDLAL